MNIMGAPVHGTSRDDGMRVFLQLLLNSLLSGVMSTFLWFAVTFWVYLETLSVLATAMIGGAFSLLSAGFGMVFGTFVDRHRKKSVMIMASSMSLVAYALAALQYVVVPGDQLLDVSGIHLWVFIALILSGSVVGNMRNIALSTCVTLLVPQDRRDRANGMVGTVTGVSFAITSVFSGLVIGMLGMGWAVGATVVLTAVAVGHLFTIDVKEDRPAVVDGKQARVDIRGTRRMVKRVDGLIGLIVFAAVNNMLGGVFMALMDAYGLSLVSVESWGLMWGVLSLGFIAGGLIVAKRGLGPRPLRLILICNGVNWSICSVFAVRSSVVLLMVGMAIWMTLIPVIEAAEQTVLQRVVPFDYQGRVFGFAQTIENAASPLVAFLIGPIAQIVVIPTMTDGVGADLIGGWFGTGSERGLALIFTLAGLLGIVATLMARRSGWFRRLTVTSQATEIEQPAVSTTARGQ